jgi:hypothetical protein
VLFHVVGRSGGGRENTGRMATIVLSALVAHTGWHWLTERLDQLRQFPAPSLDLMLMLTATRWLTVIAAVAAVAWFAARRGVRFRGQVPGSDPGTCGEKA